MLVRYSIGGDVLLEYIAKKKEGSAFEIVLYSEIVTSCAICPAHSCFGYSANLANADTSTSS